MPKKHETFDEFLRGARTGKPLTNSVSRAPMTRERLQALILQGFGLGRNENYTPWIRVTRINAPRRSNHQVTVVSGNAAPLHLLSALEYGAARVASWLGANEIRTQLPMFPWDGHPHPSAGLDRSADTALPTTRGLLAIAEEACIPHGTYVGASDLPYVATADIVISTCSDRPQRLAFWNVKPRAQLDSAKPGSRLLQRIRLERLYAHSVGAHHAVYDGSAANDRLLGNLDWLEPLRDELRDGAQSQARDAFVAAFREGPANAPLGKGIEVAASKASMPLDAAQRHFRAAAWLGLLDIDLTEPVLMSRPMTTGGAAKKRALQVQLLGEEA